MYLLKSGNHPEPQLLKWCKAKNIFFNGSKHLYSFPVAVVTNQHKFAEICSLAFLGAKSLKSRFQQA